MKQKEEKVQNKSKIEERVETIPLEIGGTQDEDCLRITEFYQSSPRRHRRKTNPREIRVALPHICGKDDIEVYIDWK